MIEKRFRFTEPRIKALICPPPASKAYYYDTSLPGLEIAVTKSGTKSYSAYHWSNAAGRPLRVALGKWPTLTVETARKLAANSIREIVSGSNPNAAKRALRDELTVASAADRYFEFLQAQERKTSTLVTYEYFNRRFLVPWKNKRLNTITVENILNLRTKVRDKDGEGSQGPKQDPANKKTRPEKKDRRVTANRVVRLVSQIFNHAIRSGWNGTNPCDSIKPFPEKPATRRLEDHEVGPFIAACNSLRAAGDPCGDFLLMCLYTGVRRRNISSAMWKDISLQFSTWSIADTKNNLPHRVYLSEQVKQILEQRRKAPPLSPFVFPAVSKSGHLEDPHKGLARALKIAEIDPSGFTIHSLKHSFVSFAYEAGINPIVVARMGGHKVAGITARYGHASEKSIREGYERVAQSIQSQGASSSTGTVLSGGSIGK